MAAKNSRLAYILLKRHSLPRQIIHLLNSILEESDSGPFAYGKSSKVVPIPNGQVAGGLKIACAAEQGSKVGILFG